MANNQYRWATGKFTKCIKQQGAHMTGSSWKSIPVVPHTLPTGGTYWVMFEQWLRTVYWHNNVSSGYITASSGAIFLKICVLDPTNIQNTQNVEIGVWLYLCYTVWQLHVWFPFIMLVCIFLILQFNRRKTVYFKVMTQYVCCRWSSLEQFWVVSVRQVTLWWLCVAIVVLSAKEIKELLFEEPFICFIKVCQDICNLWW